MNYPGTIFELIDQSQYDPIKIEEPIVKPLFMAAITSDKGPEDYRVVEGDKFFKLYGDKISFEKHGQPLLQAANTINAGGALFVKRVVDPNATLANLAILATLTKVEEQKTNASGELIYLAKDGTETIDSVDPIDSTPLEPVMVSKCKVTFSAQTVTSVKSPEEVIGFVQSGITTPPAEDGTGTYPLFVVTDNGRGESNKYFQITPDYTSSKGTEYTHYLFKVIEDNVNMESIAFAFNPDTVDGNVNVSMKTRLDEFALQVKVFPFDESIKAYIEAIGKIAGITDEAELSTMDALFGKNIKGVSIPSVVIDDTGINLSHSYGLRLESGDSGTFIGEVPTAADYETEMAKVFDGTFDTCIYDVDNYKIDVIVDANYPAAVKRAIENFVEFRQDCFYFRDMGLGLKTVNQIIAANDANMASKFCATYLTTYDIIDPYSKKQVTVTMMYDLARLIVHHFSNGRNRPLAGQLHDMILSSAIEGTVNFIPTITPAENQKETLSDARINYASYFDGVLVLETLWTSQEKMSQFSYVNNILAIQEVIKAVRTRCPKIRYSFMDGEDLEDYKKDVQGVIDKYTSNFMDITLEYISDAAYISNKIFYAAIKVKFRNFVQTEYFKVIALPS